MVVNPPDWAWGTVSSADGSVSGLFADLVGDRVDFSVGAIFGTRERFQVSDFSTFLDYGDTLTLASPRSIPQRYLS